MNIVDISEYKEIKKKLELANIELAFQNEEKAKRADELILANAAHKRSEAVLRQYEHIVSTSTDMLALLDRNYCYLAANKAYLDACEKSADGLVGETASEILGEEFFNTIIKPHADLCLSGGKINYQDWFHFPSYPPKYMDINYIPYIGENKEISGFVVNARDITERMNAEKSLRESEERWQFAIEGNQDGLWDWNVMTNEVFFSKQWKAMLGYEEDEIDNNLDEWKKNIHPDDKEQVLAVLTKHLDGEDPFYESEHRVLSKDGSYKWILDRGKVITWSEDKKPQRMLGTHTDITERKKTEAELFNTTNLLKSVINTSQDLIYIKDTQLRTLLCNDSFAHAINKEPEELYGRTDIENGWAEELVKGNSDKGIRGFEADSREALSGKTVKIEYEEVSIKDEIRFFNTVKSPLTDEKGNIIGVLGIGRDVTDHKDMEDELRHMATHDPLTGLYNRRIFTQRIDDEIERASRYQHTLSIFMIDIDYFKSINDNYGHQTGDTILCDFAKILSGSIRNSDYAARYGGEEFVIVLPETPLLKAEELAERLRKKIADTDFSIKDNEDINLTVSIGIATFPEHAESSHELIRVVDAAMYTAKAEGRNKVKIPV